MPADDSQNLRDEVESDEMPGWLPPALRRNAAPGLGLALRRLGLGEQDLHEVRAMIARDVADARARGGSWGQIGLALGISAEAARTRYGRPTGRPAPGEGS